MIGLAGILVLISGFYYRKNSSAIPPLKSEWIQKIDSLTAIWSADTLPDINRAEAGQMIRGGVPVKFAFRIEKMRNKVGKFHSWEQLWEVYGMTDSIYRVIRRETSLDTSGLSKHNMVRKPKKDSDTLTVSDPYITETARDTHDQEPIDINTADSFALVRLRGIGPVLSGRILAFRERLGGFCLIEQVKETYGLPPETYNDIRDKIAVIQPCNKVNPNKDSLEALSSHLYIPDWMAEKIVRIRNRDSLYMNEADFKVRTGFKEPYFSRLKPYLAFD
jgi:DNA uptake protein ComE-like DNA-binding protein